MSDIAFQDQYLDTRADCWGCGRNNHHGLHIKSHWDGDTAVAHYQPNEFQTGHKGILNGGIIATLMDCHCIGLAMAHAHRQEGRKIGSQPLITYVTASLKVDYISPTVLDDNKIELRAQVEWVDKRKTFVTCSIFAQGIETAKGEILGVRILETPQPGN
jgi:acyl-coenzyme A thioesterase PaaI-like protein